MRAPARTNTLSRLQLCDVFGGVTTNWQRSIDRRKRCPIWQCRKRIVKRRKKHRKEKCITTRTSAQRASRARHRHEMLYRVRYTGSSFFPKRNNIMQVDKNIELFALRTLCMYFALDCKYCNQSRGRGSPPIVCVRTKLQSTNAR